MKQLTEFLTGEKCRQIPDESLTQQSYREGCNEAVDSISSYLAENPHFSKQEIIETVNNYLAFLLDPTSDKSITGVEFFNLNLK